MADASGLVEYEQVAASLRGQIRDGTIASGQPVQATDFAAHTGSPLRACARALECLRQEGLLTRYPGLGYHAARPAAGTEDGDKQRIPRQRATSALCRAR
jgi:DNA-binding GntR family transcriptional regulator